MMFKDYIKEGEIFVRYNGYRKIIKVVDDVLIYEGFAVPAMWGPWHNPYPGDGKIELYYSLGEKGGTRGEFLEWIKDNMAVPLSLAKRLVESMEPDYPAKRWAEGAESLRNFQEQYVVSSPLTNAGDCRVSMPVFMNPD